jgi:hypothetical protein
VIDFVIADPVIADGIVILYESSANEGANASAPATTVTVWPAPAHGIAAHASRTHARTHAHTHQHMHVQAQTLLLQQPTIPRTPKRAAAGSLRICMLVKYWSGA